MSIRETLDENHNRVSLGAGGAALLLGVAGFTVARDLLAPLASAMPDGATRQAYASLFTASLALFGFTMTCVSIVNALLSGSELKAIRKHKDVTSLTDVFFDANLSLGILAVWSFLCLLFAGEQAEGWGAAWPVVAIGMAANSFCRVFFCLRYLKRLLRLVLSS